MTRPSLTAHGCEGVRTDDAQKASTINNIHEST